MNHTMNFTQFSNYVENGATCHPDELELGEWTIRKLFEEKDLDIIHNILKFHNEGWEPCNEFNDYDDFIDGVLSQSVIVGAEKYVKLPIIQNILKALWKDYFNPHQWSLGEKLDKWIILYQRGQINKIGFPGLILKSKSGMGCISHFGMENN